MGAAVILAGGKSTRMGEDKLVMRLGGETVLSSAVRRFAECFDRVYISVGEAGKYPGISAAELIDTYRGCGPMAGLHAAFTQTEEQAVFLAAADLPYSSPEAALRIAELCGDMDACVIRDDAGNMEPLFGCYRCSILPRVEAFLAGGQRKMTRLVEESRTRYVNPKELGDLWDERIVLNMNRPEDYERAKKWLDRY